MGKPIQPASAVIFVFTVGTLFAVASASIFFTPFYG